MTDNTAAARCCCLNRWACAVNANGKTRDQMPTPCGFEMCGTVEGCPKAARLMGVGKG